MPVIFAYQKGRDQVAADDKENKNALIALDHFPQDGVEVVADAPGGQEMAEHDGND
jgi:hypothetical protein